MQAGSTCKDQSRMVAALSKATCDMLAPIDDLMLPAGCAPNTGVLPLDALQNLEVRTGW